MTVIHTVAFVVFFYFFGREVSIEDQSFGWMDMYINMAYVCARLVRDDRIIFHKMTESQCGNSIVTFIA